MGADNAKIQLDEVNNVNEFKITADVEFNRPYDNAKHDILKAIECNMFFTSIGVTWLTLIFLSVCCSLT